MIVTVDPGTPFPRMTGDSVAIFSFSFMEVISTAEFEATEL